MYTYRAKLYRVIDGDSVELNIDLGFSVWVNEVSIRLLGVDTPETRTKDLLEKHFGLLASDYVLEKLIDAEDIIVTTQLDRADKFGRMLGTIWVDGEEKSINAQLLEKSLGVEYKGQNKSEVKAQHINNFKELVENQEVKLSKDLQELYNQL